MVPSTSHSMDSLPSPSPSTTSPSPSSPSLPVDEEEQDDGAEDESGDHEDHVTPLDGTPGGREPDADAIKMFVGQIPREWNEQECKSLFIEFGDIYCINVLRDKGSGLSRGCCFVTYFHRRDALEAQNALHNIRTLTGMHHPIQMKPADSENRNERKLFIGMLAKKYTENDVRLMFAAYGNIEECTILRDQNSVSKGCAFVTFGSRQCAVNAIKHMNHSQTMEGCSAPIVVKFADTQKDKDARRQQQILMQQLAAATVPPPPAPHPSLTNPYTLALAAAAASAAQHQHHHQQQQQQQQVQQQQQQQQQQMQQQHQHLATAIALQQLNGGGGDPSALSVALSLAATNPLLLASMVGPNPSHASTGASTPSTGSHLNGSADIYGQNTITSNGNGHHPGFNFSVQALAQLAAHQSSPQGQQQQVMSQHAGQLSNGTGKQIEGPDGANLFIYHLPAEFLDPDLAQAFSPFGHVLSSKVFIDKVTNLSKCFGFVSYDNPHSAQAAIQSMNGFNIGTKRLKVQLKRSKDSKPY